MQSIFSFRQGALSFIFLKQSSYKAALRVGVALPGNLFKFFVAHLEVAVKGIPHLGGSDSMTIVYIDCFQNLLRRPDRIYASCAEAAR